MIRIKDNQKVIGDVDIFFTPEGTGEINILIAPPEQRRKGFASEALVLMMQYGNSNPIHSLIIRLFINSNSKMWCN